MKKNIIIGFTSGVFDLFHIVHVNILKNAKSMCDKLIVGVTSDELMLSYKNKKPVIPFVERAKIVRNIKFVDSVVVQENMDKFETWKKIKFDLMFVGDDWHKNEKWGEYEKLFSEVNVRIIYFPYTKGTSSTKINRILDAYR